MARKTVKTEVSRPMVILNSGEKGGVGKTFVAHALTTFYDRQGLQTAMIDADQANKGLRLIFGDRVEALTLFNDYRPDHDAMNSLMERLIEPPAERLIVDLGAAQLNAVVGLMRSTGAFDLIGEAFDLSIIYTCVNSPQSLLGLQNTLVDLDLGPMGLVVNLNERDGAVGGYLASDLPALVGEVGAKVIVTPLLSDDPTLGDALAASGLPMEAFLAHPGTRTIHRLRLGKWLSQVERSWVEHAGGLLGLGAAPSIQEAAE